MKVLEVELNLHPGLDVLTLPSGKVWIQRDDLIHPIISGNKWRKLEGHLMRMRDQGKTCLLTYGGAFSNHLVAAAVAAELMGFGSIGILRGDESIDNHYLKIAKGAGMKIVGVSRSLYRDKSAALAEVMGKLGFNESDVYVVPEGGCSAEGFIGFDGLIGDWLLSGFNPDHIFHASATATTAVGLKKAMDVVGMCAEIHAVMVLRNVDEQLAFSLEQGVAAVIESEWLWPKARQSSKLSFVCGYEFGGYAKRTVELDAFVGEMRRLNGISFEPIYTGKALFALNEWLKRVIELGQLIPDESEVYSVVFLHTGGTLNADV